MNRLVYRKLSRFGNFNQSCSSVHICIVGSGPSAFYMAQYILKYHKTVKVDMFEKLPTPFGLIRYGVAPDHPEVKNVIKTFTEVAKNPRFSFFGNVTIGRDLTLCRLQQAYAAIIWAYGAATDRLLNIPGEDLPSVISAKDLVGWYNGDPCNKHISDFLNCKTVAIIGMGNVALDVARILLSSTKRLESTDIPDAVMKCLVKSHISKVVMIGRRSPLQVAFTLKEIRELSKLKAKTQNELEVPLRINILPRDVFKTYESNNQFDKLLADLPRPRRRLMEFLYKLSKTQTSTSDSLPTCDLQFLRSPAEIMSSSVNSSRLQLKLAVNKIHCPFDPNSKAVPDVDQIPELLHCDLIVRSIGYRGLCIDPDLPFDHQLGIIKCKDSNGRIVDLPDNYCMDSVPSPMYCTGWIKRGPVGVILDTAVDARQTSEAILTDLNKLKECNNTRILHKPGQIAIENYLSERNIRPVTFEDWERVDRVEKLTGEYMGKSREKLTSIESILNAAFSKTRHHKFEK